MGESRHPGQNSDEFPETDFAYQDVDFFCLLKQQLQALPWLAFLLMILHFAAQPARQANRIFQVAN